MRAAARQPRSRDGDKGILYEDASREFERRFLQCALDEAEGNIGRAADQMGVHRNTLSRKMDEQHQEAVATVGRGPGRRCHPPSTARRRIATGS